MENRFANLAKAFPDFDLSSLPEIPESWEDISWRHDACPCFEISKDEKTGNRTYIFVDYVHLSKCEMPELEYRFSIHSEVYDGAECDCTTLIETNDFEAVLTVAQSIEKPKGE